MSRKTASRGISALILVLGLTLAGARPAAAAGLESWDFSFDHLVSGFWAGLTGWLTGTDTDKRGFGIDPNGVAIAARPDVPADPQGASPFSPDGHP